MNVMTPLLRKALPAGVMLNAISKISPKMSSFISGATVSGFSAAQILDFLRQKVETQSERQQREGLEKAEARGTLRPDEALALKQRREAGIPAEAAKAAGVAAAGLAGGLSGALATGADIASAAPAEAPAATAEAPESVIPAWAAAKTEPDQTLPSASQMMTRELGQKQQAVQEKEQAKQMIREGVKGVRAQQEAATEGKEEDWPKLRDFIKKMLTMGKTPEETVQQANRISGFRPLIEEFERKHGIVFEDAIRHLFGGQIQQAAQQTPQQAPQAAGPSAGDQAIMQAMANFSKLLKK